MDVAAVRLFVMAVAGWWADQRQETVAYLVEENRILRAHLRGRIRLTDEERRRLAMHGHQLGRRRLSQVATLVTPDTILRWHRQLIAGRPGCGTVRVPIGSTTQPSFAHSALPLIRSPNLTDLGPEWIGSGSHEVRLSWSWWMRIDSDKARA